MLDAQRGGEKRPWLHHIKHILKLIDIMPHCKCSLSSNKECKVPTLPGGETISLNQLIILPLQLMKLDTSFNMHTLGPASFQ